MIKYSVTKNKVNFTPDFSHLICEFSYVIDHPDINENQNFYGLFVGHIDWDSYFIDPILCRFNNVPEGDNWLSSADITELNDLYYNKLAEYTSIDKDAGGELMLKIEDTVVYDLFHKEKDYYENEEEKEEKIFNSMFNDQPFIEQFKDALADPSKYNLTSALIYFQDKYKDTTEDQFSRLLKKLLKVKPHA